MAALAAPAAHAATGVVISQAAFGDTGGGNDEVFEIRNVSSAPIAIGGWELWGTNQSGSAQSSRATVPAGTTLPVGKTFVFAQLRWARSRRRPTCTYGTGHREHRRRPDPQQRQGDRDGRVRRHRVPAAYREGAGVAQPTSGVGGFVRKNGGTQDTDDNAADFTGPQDSDADEVRHGLHRRRPPGPARRALTGSPRSRASRRSAPTRRATAPRSRSAASSPASTTCTARRSARSTRPTPASGSRKRPATPPRRRRTRSSWPASAATPRTPPA